MRKGRNSRRFGRTTFNEARGRRELGPRTKKSGINWLAIMAIGVIGGSAGALIGIELMQRDLMPTASPPAVLQSPNENDGLSVAEVAANAEPIKVSDEVAARSREAAAEREAARLVASEGSAEAPEVAASPSGPMRRFTYCHVGGGTNCIVDGDTIWLDGRKIRILDIDAPETHPPRCQREAELGNAATRRLGGLLNSGVVTAEGHWGRDRDSYGRLLRRVYVDGVNVGDVLVSEGLARPYGRGRRSWC